MNRGLLLCIGLLSLAVLVAGCGPSFYERYQMLEKGMDPAEVRSIMKERPTADNIDAEGDGVIVWRGMTSHPLKVEFKKNRLESTLWVQL
jgi:hypothetical protein